MSSDTCWRVERADRLAVIVDAENYFRAARAAFRLARRRIMLVGWDFDARIVLDPTGVDDGLPLPIGDFLYELVERSPDLHLYLLRWDMGALKSLVRGTTFLTVLHWMTHPRIHVKLDGHHPTGSSHHQKIVCIDDCLAFCGGIDMTGERWDTRVHLDDDPNRTGPTGLPYKPWHDATTAVSGPLAAALGDACRERWRRAGGRPLAPVTADHDCWPAPLAPTMEGVDVAIARTLPSMPGEEPVHEVEASFLAQIASARRLIYCESQYFASRRIAEAIARRLDEPDGPEIVIVNPKSAQGWLEPIAMDSARAELMEALQARDRHGRFRLYHPRTAGGADIYVHAKVTIVDDRLLRIGSANLNNRSMRLDTECDLIVAADGEEAAHLCPVIAGIRDSLVAEHLNVPPDTVAALLAETSSLIAVIERLRGPGRSLAPYTPPDIPKVERWMAKAEILDPEGPEEMFEPLERRGLFRGSLRKRRRR